MRSRNPAPVAATLSVLRWWMLPLLWVGVIFALSTTPADSFPRLAIPHADKAVHVIEFLIFGVFLARAHRASVPGTRPMRVAVMSLLLAGTYAFFDECHQQFVPGRMVEAADLLADLAGLGMGIACYLLYAKMKGVARGNR